MFIRRRGLLICAVRRECHGWAVRSQNHVYRIIGAEERVQVGSAPTGVPARHALRNLGCMMAALFSAPRTFLLGGWTGPLLPDRPRLASTDAGQRTQPGGGQKPCQNTKSKQGGGGAFLGRGWRWIF